MLYSGQVTRLLSLWKDVLAERRASWLAAWESIAIISGSVSGTATVPKGGNCANASSPEKSDSPSDAAIDIRSLGGAPKDAVHTFEIAHRAPQAALLAADCRRRVRVPRRLFPRRKRAHCNPQITSATARSNPLRRIGMRQQHWDSSCIWLHANVHWLGLKTWPIHWSIIENSGPIYILNDLLLLFSNI